MALPASGAISFRDINVELNLSPTAQISLNDAAVRTLFAKASGAIAMSAGYGKSNRAAISYTYSASAANPSLNITTISGYAAGTSDVTITINSGIYLYSTSTGTPGLTLSGGTAGDTVTVVNNGFIMSLITTGRSAPTIGVPEENPEDPDTDPTTPGGRRRRKTRRGRKNRRRTTRKR